MNQILIIANYNFKENFQAILHKKLNIKNLV